MQEPRAFLRLGHIGEHHHGVIERMMAEVRANAAVGWKRFVLQLIVINELGLVNQEPRKGQRVRRTRAVLRDDDRDGAVVEGDDVLIVSRFCNRLTKGLRRLTANHIVDAVQVAPAFPCRQQSRDGVCQAMLERGNHDTASRARHSLHITKDEWRGDRVRLACTSASDNDCCLGTDVLGHQLGLVEVHTLLVLAGFCIPKASIYCGLSGHGGSNGLFG